MHRSRLGLLYLMAVVLVQINQACKTPSYPTTAELKYLNNPSPGLVVVESIGYGPTQHLADLDTYNTAFSTILFKGLPGFSPLKAPLISDEKNAKKDHSAYFKNFFEERKYLQFVTEQGRGIKSGKADDRRNRYAKRQFTINYESLRRDLEQNNIIRKFGL